MRLTIKPLGNFDHEIECNLSTGKWVKVIKGRKTLRVLYDEMCEAHSKTIPATSRSTIDTMKTETRRKRVIE